ncbi:nuclear transport factor 2 family protein [Paenarthrobacter sp. TYUT067]|uniref:nuclear transport factor 2 family protein n=1 Tax=Micrococcaceae TaxID=1268 RepID=UPI001CC475B9|nr:MULTISPECIES: nuclear transport factor 2 family protein [Micrococcaceae]MCM0615101.1 nuclear transport factor 2 family protein [Paenarthrobacter sp. TYUT067]
MAEQIAGNPGGLGEQGGEPQDVNENVVRRLIECINERHIEVMDELFHDDAVMHWPQSGEVVRGAGNRRGIYNAFPQLPTITPRRLLSGGNLVVAEALLDYDGPQYQTVFIFEFRDGRIARETAYWSEAFPAPEWRSQWVEISSR